MKKVYSINTDLENEVCTFKRRCLVFQKENEQIKRENVELRHSREKTKKKQGELDGSQV
jgi:hypothetical protein